MKYLNIILTGIFGLFWLIFGANGFLHFFIPPQPSGAAADFMQALEKTGYVMPLVYAAQIIAGLMLLTRYFVPLALLMLAPVVANIFLYNLFLNSAGLPIGVVITAVYLFLLFRNRKHFMPFLKP